MNRSVLSTALAVPAWALAAVGGLALAAEPSAGVPLPETEYQMARSQAAQRYADAITACGFVNWSTRLDCERAAAEEQQRAELEARSRYLRTQTEFAKLRQPESDGARTAAKPPPAAARP